MKRTKRKTIILAVLYTGAALCALIPAAVSIATRPGIPSTVYKASGHAPAATQTPASNAELLDINEATLDELIALPGIGPVIAQAIIDERLANGQYSFPEDLYCVPGIGEKRLEAIKPYISTPGVP